MKLVTVKTKHISDRNCEILRTIKEFSFLGIILFTKTVNHFSDF
jgi:hypothetical protein